MSPTTTTDEAILRDRLGRLDDHLAAIVDGEPAPAVDVPRPAGGRRRRPAAWVAAAAAVVGLVLVGGVVALNVGDDQPEEISTADQPPLPAPDDDQAPPPTAVVPQEDEPTPGGEPTAAVVDAGEALSLGVVLDWVTYPGGGWRATYAATSGGPPVGRVTTGVAPDPAAQGRDVELGEVLLPGSTETSIDGVDEAFVRTDALATDISGVRDGQFVTMSLSPSVGLDAEESVAAFQAIVEVVLGA